LPNEIWEIIAKCADNLTKFRLKRTCWDLYHLVCPLLRYDPIAHLIRFGTSVPEMVLLPRFDWDMLKRDDLLQQESSIKFNDIPFDDCIDEFSGQIIKGEVTRDRGVGRSYHDFELSWPNKIIDLNLRWISVFALYEYFDTLVTMVNDTIIKTPRYHLIIRLNRGYADPTDWIGFGEFAKRETYSSYHDCQREWHRLRNDEREHYRCVHLTKTVNEFLNILKHTGYATYTRDQDRNEIHIVFTLN
jgi:hypothetical protein